MDKFYKIVLFVASIVIVVYLIIFSMVYLFSKNTKISQVIHKCPDGWDSDIVTPKENWMEKETRCYIPVDNVSNLNGYTNQKFTFNHSDNNNVIYDINGRLIPGSNVLEYNMPNNTGKPYINFTNIKWYENSPAGMTHNCFLKQWANMNNISWNGISNNWKCKE